MFDHVELKVSNIAKSKEFYESALKPLGIKCLFSNSGMAGFGTENVVGADGTPRVEFLIEESDVPTAPIHMALTALDWEGVDKFHLDGLAAGGRDNGKPGLRSDYHAAYYAAFLFDPDGHNVEAVCHTKKG